MDEPLIRNTVAALAQFITDEIGGSADETAGRGASAPAALVTLYSNPGLSIEQLRTALRLTHSGGVRLIDRLVADGLIVRSGAFGRRVALDLTPAGRSVAIQVQKARDLALERVLSVLTAPERRQLGDLVERMLRACVVSEAQAWAICRLCDETACPNERCPVEAELREQAL